MRRLLILLVVAGVLCGCGGQKPTSTPSGPAPTATEPTWLTLDGREDDGTLAVTKINLWKDYDNRGAGVAGVGNHGDTVKLIRRSGDGVMIELANGTRGWVTYYFIKEYK